MQIKTVCYQALFNLGDYSNEKIGFVADLEESETPENVIPILRERAQALAQPDAQAVWDQHNRIQRELKELQSKLEKARSNWNSTAEFLRTQGIKPDVPEFPQFTNLLPQADQESVVQSELIDDF